MRQLKRVTLKHIQLWRPSEHWPCERFLEKFREKRFLTPLEIAGLDAPVEEILWVLLREEIIPSNGLRRVACRCADRVLCYVRSTGREPNPLSWSAVRIARRFSKKGATKSELLAAHMNAKKLVADMSDEGAECPTSVSPAVMAAEAAAWCAYHDAGRGVVQCMARSTIPKAALLQHVIHELRQLV